MIFSCKNNPSHASCSTVTFSAQTCPHSEIKLLTNSVWIAPVLFTISLRWLTARHPGSPWLESSCDETSCWRRAMRRWGRCGSGPRSDSVLLMSRALRRTEPCRGTLARGRQCFRCLSLCSRSPASPSVGSSRGYSVWRTHASSCRQKSLFTLDWCMSRMYSVMITMKPI